MRARPFALDAWQDARSCILTYLADFVKPCLQVHSVYRYARAQERIPSSENLGSFEEAPQLS
jgi:hypothetical protein